MFFTLAEAMEFSLQSGSMLSEAQLVVLMRLFGFAGLWRIQPDESMRMIQEKADAATQAALAAGQAIISGKGTGQAAIAALAPVRHYTRSNVERLSQPDPCG